MTKLFFTVVFEVALSLTSVNAMALGFGANRNLTMLGQPLNYTVTLNLAAGEVVSPECLSADVLIGDVPVHPSNIRTALLPSGPSGERVVRISTTTLVDEPVVSVTLNVGCPARISRRYTAFVDPEPTLASQPISTPAVNGLAMPAPMSRPLAPMSAAVASAASNVVVRPPLDEADKPALSPRSREPKAKPAVRTAGASSTTRKAGTPARSAGPRAAATRTAKARTDNRSTRVARLPGPRLQMEALAATSRGALVTPSKSALAGAKGGGTAAAAMAAEAAASAAASAAVAEQVRALFAEMAASQSAVSAARIQSLEEELKRVTRQNEQTQATILSMRARLDEAESNRSGVLMVYLVAAGSALLALLLLVMVLRRRSSSQSSGAWWKGSGNAPLSDAEDPVMAAPHSHANTELHADVHTPRVRHDDVAGGVRAALSRAEAERSVIVPDTSAMAIAVTLPSVDDEETDRLGTGARRSLRREMSVDELMDLEQQAEFFLVLGQDDAAVDLLRSHLRDGGGTSPMPYLKLLEIHRRLDDQAAYDAVREEFNQRFNAHAPGFEDDPDEGRALESYSDVVARLQSLWGTPERAMEVLEASLLRSKRSDTPFDLPAYREVLMLYSVARDLAEQAGKVSKAKPAAGKVDTVDVLLPMDDEDAAIDFGHAWSPMPSPMLATMPVETRAAVERPLTLDLDVSSQLDDAFPTMPQASPGPSDLRPTLGFDLEFSLPSEFSDSLDDGHEDSAKATQNKAKKPTPR